MKKIIPTLILSLLLCSCSVASSPETTLSETDPSKTAAPPSDETAASAEASVPAETTCPTETSPPTEAPDPTEAPAQTESPDPTDATAQTEASQPTEATASPTETPSQEEDLLGSILDGMSVEEKVGQMFLAFCPGDGAAAEAAAYHLGGYILFASDFTGETPASFREKIESYQNAVSIPLLIAVDEEGGTVNRVSNFTAFRDTPFPSPRSLYASGGIDAVLAIEAEKSSLLRSLGIQVNMAPVCDITMDPAAFMYSRSLGLEPEEAGQVIAAMVQTMRSYGVGSVLKHFPGYGNNTDTHTAMAIDSRTLEELESWDLIPFAAGIAAGCDAIMVSHVIVEALDPVYPATLSPEVHRYLREEMGFEGVIVTDDLAMQAISDSYGAGEAAVSAVLAGNDLLCCQEYQVQYAAVLEAVEDGRISMELLDSAVTRILQWKIDLGLIT